MTHTVCGQPVTWREQVLEDEPELRLMVPVCETCACDVPDLMLIEDQIQLWRADDAQGYHEAIGLLCKAETELRKLRPTVSPGRPWELVEENADLPQA